MAVDHRGTVVLANQALRDGLQLQDPAGRHYLEVVRQSEVGTLLEEVLGTGAARHRRSRCCAAAAPTRSRACGSRAPRASPMAPSSPSTT
jgi:hypothetical protein